jgi:hypothetical protein
MAASKKTVTASTASGSSWIGFTIKLVCVMIIAGMVIWFLGWMAIDSRNSITGNTMRDLYAQEKIDILFLGSSTVYESCNPVIFDAETGERSFNAATPDQTLRESYYQLKEVCRLYNPRSVLLGVGPEHIIKPIERNSISASYLFDNMRWSPVKADFMVTAFDPDYYPSALFPAVRLRAELDTLTPPEQMFNIERLRAKLTAEDTNAAVQSEDTGALNQDDRTQNGMSGQLRYEGKGYLANLQVIEDGTLPEAPPLGFTGPDSAATDALYYLNKIAGLCTDSDMRLTLFQTPLLPGATEWVGDYAAYHDFIAGCAVDVGAGFIDFNYLSPEVITYDDTMFSDLEHATEEFAQRFSQVFAGFVKDVNTSDGKFFTSYETYRELYDTIASTWVTKATASGASVTSIGTAKPEYRVAVLVDDEDRDIVREEDWRLGEDAQFQTLESGDYIVTVEARPEGDDDAEPKRNWIELRVD